MRIRTIKPEFWQSETMASIPKDSRLLAIALLNYADDEGFFFAVPQVIQGALFPFDEDSTSIRRGLDELSRIGFCSLGKTPEGKRIGRIVNFLDHQRIDRPQASKIAGLAAEWTPFVEPSSNTRRALDVGMEWNGMEEEGKARARSRMLVDDWTPLQEHRDLAALRNADCDLQLSRFRERNNGQTDTDQGWGVRFTQWLGRAKPESRVTREQVASPTLEEWMAYAREVSRGKGPDGEQWPKALAEAGWNDNQAKQWRFVSDWRADCNARALRWAGQEATIAQRNRRGR